MLCLICTESVSVEKKIVLLNGHGIHQSCYDQLLITQSVASSDTGSACVDETRLLRLIADVDSRINNASTRSLTAALSESILGFQSKSESARLRQLDSLQRERASLSSELNTCRENRISAQKKRSDEIAASLTAIYDFWPDYPPDWRTRTQAVAEKAGKTCELCGHCNDPDFRFGKRRPRQREFHVHHRMRLSRGGSHRLDNLMYLCLLCHEKQHHHELGGSDDQGTPYKSDFVKKIEFINEAIQKRQWIRFQYEKANGEKMQRDVLPIAIEMDMHIGKVQVLKGYCDLRKADRVFTINRMRDISLLRKSA